MIQQESQLLVADNSGAKIVKCIKVLGGAKRRYASVGDIIICSVQKVEPRGIVKKGDVVKAVIVRVKQTGRIAEGFHYFNTNACILVDDKNNLRGTRVFGPIDRRLRGKGFVRIISLAPEIV